MGWKIVISIQTMKWHAVDESSPHDEKTYCDQILHALGVYHSLSLTTSMVLWPPVNVDAH